MLVTFHETQFLYFASGNATEVVEGKCLIPNNSRNREQSVENAFVSF